MEESKRILIERGEIFLTKASKARGIISKIAFPFIPPDAVSLQLTLSWFHIQ